MKQNKKQRNGGIEICQFKQVVMKQIQKVMKWTQKVEKQKQKVTKQNNQQ